MSCDVQSLRGEDAEERLYRLVHEFRRRHYSAHRMTLAVKAPIGLDVLEGRVAQYFSQVSPTSNSMSAMEWNV